MRVRSPVALGSCSACMTRALLERALLDRALLDRALLDRPLLLRPLDDKPLLDRPFSEVSGSSSFTIPGSELSAQARAPIARAQDSKSNEARRMVSITPARFVRGITDSTHQVIRVVHERTRPCLWPGEQQAVASEVTSPCPAAGL